MVTSLCHGTLASALQGAALALHALALALESVALLTSLPNGPLKRRTVTGAPVRYHYQG